MTAHQYFGKLGRERKLPPGEKFWFEVRGIIIQGIFSF